MCSIIAYFPATMFPSCRPPREGMIAIPEGRDFPGWRLEHPCDSLVLQHVLLCQKTQPSQLGLAGVLSLPAQEL